MSEAVINWTSAPISQSLRKPAPQSHSHYRVFPHLSNVPQTELNLSKATQEEKLELEFKKSVLDHM